MLSVSRLLQTCVLHNFRTDHSVDFTTSYFFFKKFEIN